MNGSVLASSVFAVETNLEYIHRESAMLKGIRIDSPAITQRSTARYIILLAALAIAQMGARGSAAAPKPAGGTKPEAPVVQSATSSDYIIGPGDTLQIFVWRNPDLTTQIPVRPDGKISTPLVENMMAVGKTTSELARDIEGALEKYVRSPTVNVIVVTALSAMSEVTVVGAVATPKALPYRDGLRVMDAVLAVGGLTQFAAGNRAKIVRAQDGKQQDIPVRLKNLLEKGDLSQNVVLKPGDVLVIPESFL
jgi:polysaccharide export outer membrane protein